MIKTDFLVPTCILLEASEKIEQAFNTIDL